MTGVMITPNVDGTLSYEQLPEPRKVGGEYSPTQSFAKLATLVANRNGKGDYLETLQDGVLALECLNEFGKSMRVKRHSAAIAEIANLTLNALALDNSGVMSMEDQTLDDTELDKRIQGIWASIGPALKELNNDNERVILKSISVASALQKNLANVESELSGYSSESTDGLTARLPEGANILVTGDGDFNPEELTKRLGFLTEQTDQLLNGYLTDIVKYTKGLVSWLTALPTESDEALEAIFNKVTELKLPEFGSEWTEDVANSNDEESVLVAPALFSGAHFAMIKPKETPTVATDYIDRVLSGSILKWNAIEEYEVGDTDTIVTLPNNEQLLKAIGQCRQVCESIASLEDKYPLLVEAFKSLASGSEEFMSGLTTTNLSESGVAKLTVAVQVARDTCNRLADPFNNFLYGALYVVTAVIELANAAQTAYADAQ